MRCEHIKDGRWLMPGAPVKQSGWLGTKNGDHHQVWLPPQVRALIGDKSTGFAFGGERPVAGVAQAMRDICKALRIADTVTPRDLRRTHGTMVTRRGFGRDAMNRSSTTAAATKSATCTTATATPMMIRRSWRPWLRSSRGWSKAVADNVVELPGRAKA